jgi:hypothetical protein
MKKLLLALLFLPFMANAQLVDLSKWHDDNTLLIKTDENFTSVESTGTTNTATGVTNAAAIAVNAADIDTLEAPPHGELSFSDSASVIDVSQGVFSKITNGNNDLFSTTDAADVTIAGDTLTIIYPGDYIITASISFSGSVGDTWEFALFENGVLASPKMERSTSQTDIGNVSLPFYVEGLVAGDDLSLRITNTASSDDPTMVSGSWVIWRLHK